MIRTYRIDSSPAIALGELYAAPRFCKEGHSTQLKNDTDPPYIADACLMQGAQGTYLLLLVAAEKPIVVHQRRVELKRQFGIDSAPLALPPSELETELATSLMSLQARFERIKRYSFNR